MFNVPVFRAERDAGLEQLIRSTASVSLASSIQLMDPQQLSEKAVAAVRGLSQQIAKAALGDIDIHFMHTILATTGWNNNDDVFDQYEMWLARATPLYKPFNFEHVGDDIIGTTISSTTIDADGKTVADDTVMDELPQKFHILNGDVIWKYWEDSDKQKRMDQTLAEIARNEWFVSMECLFKGFDYALKGPQGCRIVARSEKTAFLSKHLRVYGGTGNYNEYKVGRLLRNILFSGKGLVRNPANPESVILNNNTSTFVASAAENLEQILQVSESEVYSPVVQPCVANDQNKKDEIMALELADLQKQLDAAKAENETLKASLKDNDIKVLNGKIEALTADLAKANESVSQKVAVEAELATTKASVEKLTKDLEEANKTIAETSDELKKIYAEQDRKDRLAKIMATLKVDPTNAEQVKAAEELNNSIADLSKEKFEAFVATQAKFTPAPLPPKSTPAPNPPAATDKPAPMAGKAAETDPAEANADTTVLDQAVASQDPALTVTPPAAVSNLAKSIAACFGMADDNK